MSKLGIQVAIVGGNFIGRGAEAMMTVVVTELRKRLPGVSFVVIQPYTTLPERAKVFADEYRVVYVPIRPRTFWDCMFLPVGKLLGLSLPHVLQFWRGIRDCVAILDIRGFTFRPDMGIRGAHGTQYYVQAALARACGTKHIILPQAMGPVDGWLHKCIAVRSLLMAESITVRDQTTKMVLDSIQVTRRKRVDVCPDIAFLFNASPVSLAREILSKNGIGSGPFLVLTPNMRIYERSESVAAQNVYVTEHVNMIRHIRQTLGYRVLLVAHEAWPPGWDDWHVINEIRSKLGEMAGVYALAGDCSAADIKAVIGCAEAIVGSRYHSLVASLSMGVPSIAISWSHKYEELMASVGSADYCVPYRQLSKDAVCTRLSRLLAEREKLRDHINQAVGAFRGELGRLFDDTASVIEGAHHDAGMR